MMEYHAEVMGSDEGHEEKANKTLFVRNRWDTKVTRNNRPHRRRLYMSRRRRVVALVHVSLHGKHTT